MTDLQRTDQPTDAPEDLDTEGHAATWKTVQDPQTGQRKLSQAWTADEPKKPGTSGRVTTQRPSPQR